MFDFLDKTSDAAIYFWMGAVATGLFLLKLVLLLMGGDDSSDLGDGGGHATHHPSSTGSFEVFSVLSILAFFMGAGWMGLTARLDWELSGSVSALIAVGSGTTMMLIASGIMFYIRKFDHEVQYDLNTAVGKTGRVYLTIPAKGQGRGQVEVDVSGRRKVMPAITNNDKSIDAFASVRITEVRDDQTLVVDVMD